MPTTAKFLAEVARLPNGAVVLPGAVLERVAKGFAASTGFAGSAGFTASATQRTHIIRSAVANRTVVYGRSMVSGPLVFGDTSADNGTIYLVVPIAGHEIDAVEELTDLPLPPPQVGAEDLRLLLVGELDALFERQAGKGHVHLVRRCRDQFVRLARQVPEGPGQIGRAHV